MKQVKLIAALLVVLYSFNSRAQVDTSANKPKSSGNIIVFDDGSSNKNKSAKDITDAMNIIKINPLLAINGDISVYYERVITKKITIEVAPGITYRDFWYDVFNNGGQSSGSVDGLALTPVPMVPQGYGTSHGGYSFKIGVRYYPGVSNLVDGWYLSPEFSFRNYNMSYLNYDSTSQVATYSPGHSDVTELKFLVGYEKESKSLNNFFWDAYAGLGYRNISGVEYLAETNGPYTYRNDFSYSQFTVYLGIMIGFGFKD